jgi:hypothetical protein
VKSGPSTGPSTFDIETAVKWEKQPTWHGEDRRAGHRVCHAGNVFPVHEVEVRRPLVHVLRPNIGEDQPRVEGERGSSSPGVTLVPIVNVVSQDSVTVGGLYGGRGGHPGGGIGDLVAAQPVGGAWKEERGYVFLSRFLGTEGFRERGEVSVAKREDGRRYKDKRSMVCLQCLRDLSFSNLGT